MAHRARQDVVHHNQRMRPFRRILKGAIDPRILTYPVLRHAIPQHAGIAIGDQVIDRRAAQQMWPDLSAAAEWPKQFWIFREAADQLLSLCDFRIDGVLVRILAEWYPMRERMIAD